MAGIVLEWSQHGDFDSFSIYRSTSPMILDALPQPIITDLKTMFYVDLDISNTFSNLYYRIAVIRGSSVEISDEYIMDSMAGFILITFDLNEKYIPPLGDAVNFQNM